MVPNARGNIILWPMVFNGIYTPQPHFISLLILEGFTVVIEIFVIGLWLYFSKDEKAIEKFPFTAVIVANIVSALILIPIWISYLTSNSGW